MGRAFYLSATRNETLDDALRCYRGNENTRWLAWMRDVLSLERSVAIFDKRLKFERRFFAELECAHRDDLLHEPEHTTS